MVRKELVEMEKAEAAMNEKILDKHFENIRKILLEKFNTSKIIKHPGTVGTERELFIKEFLQSHLPDNLRITSGIIFDSKGNSSKQQDLVLYRAKFPKIGMSKTDLLFVEGVLATIEVKSNLTESNIGTVLENILSVKKLQRSTIGASGIGVTHNFPLTKILSVVFSYNGSELNQIKDEIGEIWINNWDEDIDKLPDMVIVLNRGILIRNSGELLPKEEKSIIYLEEGDKSKCLKLLFLKLTEIAGTFSNVMVNWNDYC
ncbi:MAG: hypothetical protein N2V75_11935 [Methanophagales archaeon]|nr:hypothetical protein [Methanophagales archaeon]